MPKNKSRYSLPQELAASPKRRPARVADMIRNVIASLLLFGVKDPRVQNVTIVRARVTDDLRMARIFFSCPLEQADEAMAGLSSARGFIRSHLAKEIKMRYVPELIFEYDTNQDKSDHLNAIFEEIKKKNESTS
ncbi:MAG: 30S ribosome-binding factor RbfA [Proteobacteria bacterium]|nr:30S ribosome-binding factor RbfA [Pseudomonadota bacterium]MBU1639085.1 30S ribosome-binding factor RbfA [Pseudomonadota bacterium]